MTPPLRRKLTWFLAGGLICFLIAIAAYLYLNQVLKIPVTVSGLKIDSQAALKLNILKQVSKKDGVTQWELTAETATVLKHQDRAVLEDVTVLYFLENDRTVVLTARKGTLDTRAHDMHFTDGVVINYATAELRTDQLQYHKKDHIITSDTRIRLERSGSFIEADTARIDLNRNQILLEGNIQGRFDENFSLQF